MIKPKPFKLICPKCKYTKIIRPQSDSFNIMDAVDICPRCAVPMKYSTTKRIPNVFTSLFGKLFG